MRELRNTKIIAVDHGYGNMKTANTVTPTGIKAYETEPIFTGNILKKIDSVMHLEISGQYGLLCCEISIRKSEVKDIEWKLSWN